MHAIEVASVSVKYRIPHEKRASLLTSIIRAIKGGRYSYEELWALKDINVNVTRGEMLGIVGENGSGKTTLLSVMGNIIKPDSGTCTVNGKAAPFLGLGVGFREELTAKENIYIYGSIMGLTNYEIARKMESIIDFGGLRQFQDANLKSFSSGMLMRLGFSIAINVDADILLIDEVLSVGDESFQQKCLDKLREFRNEGKTIILVTHALNQVVEFCDRAILLHKGKVSANGKPMDVINRYRKTIGVEKEIVVEEEKQEEQKEEERKREEKILNYMLLAKRWVEQREKERKEEEKKVKFLGGVKVDRVDFFDGSRNKKNKFKSGEKFVARIRYFSKERIKGPVFGIGINKQDGSCIYGPNTKHDHFPIDYIEGKGEIEYAIDSLPILEGKYSFCVVVHSRKSAYIVYGYSKSIFTFRVTGTRGGREGVVYIPSKWKIVEGGVR